jgi:UDP-4-amino-4,6-dideoxy-N-acetyl-beta-L-altrosamine transaminase
MIPYGRQTLDERDKKAVLEVLNTNYLTTGPKVNEFEKIVCDYVGSTYGVAVNSGTAALHCAMEAIGIEEGDEVIVPSISFVASANCILFQKGKPVFCDVNEKDCNIDDTLIERLITSKTKAILIVDMCGNPCEYDKIREICNKRKLVLIQDAAHSLGADYNGKKVGSYADITCFSFHPVKNITTCEGGMLVTNNEIYYKKAMSFRSHGISRDFKAREKAKSHEYDMTEIGYNYRIPDLLCALGISQMDKLDNFIKKRREIAKMYDDAFKDYSYMMHPLEKKNSAHHIYSLVFYGENMNTTRDAIFKELKEANIGVNVHYKPIYRHSYYEKLGYKQGLCPISEQLYERLITIPIFPTLKKEEINYISNKIIEICRNNMENKIKNWKQKIERISLHFVNNKVLKENMFLKDFEVHKFDFSKKYFGIVVPLYNNYEITKIYSYNVYS